MIKSLDITSQNGDSSQIRVVVSQTSVTVYTVKADGTTASVSMSLEDAAIIFGAANTILQG